MEALSALQHDALVELFNIGVGQAASALADIVGEEVTMSVPTIRFVGRARACALLAGIDGTWIDGADGDTRVCGVRQRYEARRADGDVATAIFHTEAVVIFAESACLDIVRMMVSDGVSCEELTAMEQEAMGEIGNIVLNACVGTLANLLGQELRGSLPVIQMGSGAAILSAPHCGTGGRGAGVTDAFTEAVTDAVADAVADGIPGAGSGRVRGASLDACLDSLRQPPADADPIIMLLQIDLALEAQQIRGYIAFLLEMDALEGLRQLVDAYLAQLADSAGAAINVAG